ncbi:hypothetical protein [Streptomyces sp. NBC_00299]|uniref:hypothetical protein n=1 Tax=Streptomyces sp. NBC_00299 TaxID=2975705 RepID=UPI002E2AE668|nr:hypothetical protein [Streptomyces sp. NBC_00299]
MSRRHRALPAPERHLMAHLRSTVWGPAEFIGLPPRWLAMEGLAAGCVGVGAIVGATVAGAWYGVPGLADGEGGLVCAVALAIYLCVVRAGRALVGIVAVLGVCLALHAPQAAVGLVLAERGRVESVVVTSVEGGPGAVSDRGRYLCSVADRDGMPLKVRIWRGCGETTRPGDALAVVYDSKGRVPPRGVEAGASRSGFLRDLGGWAAALVAACLVAVVRSYRLSRAVSALPPASAVES